MATSRKPVIIITGVSSGIGLAAARRFSEAGWIVVGTVRGRRSQVLMSLNIDIQLAEMSEAADLARLVRRTFSLYGRIDVLVCNAGYALVGLVESLDYAKIRDQFMVNTIAPAELSRQVIPIMRRQNQGVIIYLSSVVGRTGLAGFGMYAASKWALEGMAESLSDELANTGVKLKLIEPTGIDTPFWHSLRRGKDTDYLPDKRLSQSVINGLSAERVAAEVYLAATDKSERLRYPVGRTWMVEIAKRILPDRLFRLGMRRALR